MSIVRKPAAKRKPRGWSEGARRRSAATDPKKVFRFEIFGRFDVTREKQTFERVEIESASMVVAGRRALKELFRRDSVKWLPHDDVTITIRRLKDGGGE